MSMIRKGGLQEANPSPAPAAVSSVAVRAGRDPDVRTPYANPIHNTQK